jgi:DNA-binding transcriptional LysR family regulator
LEEEVGFKLFDRLPRGVKINAVGNHFSTMSATFFRRSTMQQLAQNALPLGNQAH